MADERDKTLRQEYDIKSREVYDFYRKHRKKPCKGIDQYNYFKKSIDEIFAIIARMMVESEGGVYISGLGYFCFVKYPKKCKDRKNKNKYIILKKERYFPYFFPDKRLKSWTMSEAFNFRIYYLKSKSESKEYKLHFDLCESYKPSKIESNKKR